LLETSKRADSGVLNDPLALLGIPWDYQQADFLSAITSYANSLWGPGWPLKGPVIADLSAIAPDFP
jgi:hypothetical protein